MADQNELDPDRAKETLEKAQEAADTKADQNPDDPTEPTEEEERFRKEKGGAGEARKTNTGRSPEDQRGEPDPKERSSTA